MEKKYTWYKIANTLEEIEFSPDGLAEIEAGGKKICLSLHKEKLYACAAKCPHAGGSLSGGYLDAVGNIVCPLHRYKFSLETGRNTTGEGYFLKTYPAKQRENGIFIAIEEKSMLGWLK